MNPRSARAFVPEALTEVVVPVPGGRVTTPPAGPASRPRLSEPPAFRAHPLAPAGACVNCGNSLAGGQTPPRCWECGRPLCVDCYWRHGLAPADHRCAGCAIQGPSLTVSGGRAAPAAP